MSKTPRTRSGTVPILHLPDRDRWQLTIYADGKRKRTYHETEAEAERAWKDHCAHLKRFGTNAAQFSPEDLREFAEARRILPGVDLRDAASFYRHTNASQLYRSYVAKLVSREEAGRFCSILPTKNPAQVATGRGL